MSDETLPEATTPSGPTTGATAAPTPPLPHPLNSYHSGRFAHRIGAPDHRFAHRIGAGRRRIRRIVRRIGPRWNVR